MVDDREMREAKRDYLDFLDDDVSPTLVRFYALLWPEMRTACGANKRLDTRIIVLVVYWQIKPVCERR